MAKLTLSFKDRKLKVFALQPGDCLIGRASDCTIQIDSLAIEPHHARVHVAADGATVEAMADTAQTQVNGENIAEAHTLAEGDQIQVGKHTLRFSEEANIITESATVRQAPSIGWIQIQSGAHLGRAIRLNKAFTRIGKAHAELAVIARRDQGYYISRLQGQDSPQINEQDIGEGSHRLRNGDYIRVGELRLQFFADADVSQRSATQLTETE